MKLHGLLLAGILGGASTGCDTVSNRIRETSAFYNGLPSAVQNRIRAGYIGHGFTPEMVYMAQGKPTQIMTAADGNETTWIYWRYVPPESRKAMPRGIGHAVDKAFGPGDSPGDGRDGGGQVIPTRQENSGVKMRRDLVVRFVDGRVVDLQITNTPE